MNSSDFDKYYYYHTSVQSPEFEADFLVKTFAEVRGYFPKKLREDFCGTYALSCEVAKLKVLQPSLSELKIFGVDHDPEPLTYGKDHYESELSEEQRGTLCLQQANVLTGELPKAQLAFALNFSYFIFKKREVLKQYFQNAYNSLEKDGVLVLDCFGGSDCHEANEEETEHEDEGFSYFWDQDSFNPVNNHAQYYIHFQREGEEKREKVFSYDWRLWSIAEIREILAEVGFVKSHVYWEGTDEDGEGDGNFSRTEVGEDCESWVSYLVAEK